MADLRLYVIMRNDLDSLGAGKAIAQSNHAYGALKAHVRVSLPFQPLYIEWQKQTPQDFGTTIAKIGDYNEIADAIGWARKYLKGMVLAGWVTDPEYPVRDGAVTHLLPLVTCAYIFGPKEACDDAVGHLDLYPNERVC